MAFLGLAGAKSEGADGNDDEEDDVLHGVVVFWLGYVPKEHEWCARTLWDRNAKRLHSG